MIVLGYNGFGATAEIFARLYGATGVNRHLVFGHDSSAALLIDGRLVAAVEEERLNREKKTARFPINAIRWCLDEAGIDLDEVDIFAHSWQFSADALDKMITEITDDRAAAPSQKFDRLGRLAETYDALFSRDAVRRDFAKHLGRDLPDDQLVQVPHHIAHLMTGYHLAGGADAAFLVSDGRAEWLSAIMGEVRDGQVKVFDDATISYRHSLAMLFSVVTRYLGFVPNNDEYKVMGLAGYGPSPEPNPFLEHVLTLQPDGTYTLPYPSHAVPSYFELFDRLFDGSPERRDDFHFRVRVACAAQHMIEQATLHQLRPLEVRSDLPHLIFEGGLALNCVNNTKLLESSRFEDIAVSFGASDVGVAIGAAFHASQQAGVVPDVTGDPYLGPAFDDAAIRATLEQWTDQVIWHELDAAEVPTEAARLLESECVVGWFQGRMEYGPRALGNRSILANPSFPGIKDTINSRIKHREPFRPFAPIVLEHIAPRVFDLGKKTSSPYMTFVVPVRTEYQEAIQGACHVDGTSRLQTVTTETNPLLAELLDRFEERTGIPCLINTSFNVAGEPIVCTPADAIACYLSTEMDYLVLGRYLVIRRDPAEVPR